MRISMTLRTRIAAAFSALSVLAVAGSVHAQFSPPTCVPPNCSPEVIQNILITGTAQTASINITGSGKMGGTFQTGALAPVLTLATDNLMYGNVGGTSTNGSLILLQFGSADRLRVTLTGQQQLPLGSVGAPSYSFIGDTNTGFYSSAADSVSFVTNGVSRTTVNNTGTTVNSGVLSLPTGSAAAPSLTFTGDTNTGIYRSAADTIQIVTTGTNRLTVDPTGAVTVPGSLTVTGTFTSSGGLSGDGSALTNLNASNITSGTLADARLSTNVPLENGTQTFTGVNTFSNAGNSFTGSGAGLTSLNAANISSGTLADGRLSSNVALYDANGTFTGSNLFSGMTSFGSEALVAGAGQNLVYGVVDGTSAGSLMLLQSEAGGVYTDRFRVSAAGAVTAASFAGVGTSLTALNASQLTSGTVPSARISGTYSNALTLSGANTYSNRSTFGSATLVVAAGQSLLTGNVDTTSAGDLLSLQKEGVPQFRVDASGNVTAAGSLTVTGSITAGGSALCQQNGTNCPPDTITSVSGSGAGISVAPTTGAVIVSNTGVTSLIAGPGIGLSGATGDITVSNTGLTGAGTTNYVSKFTSASVLGNSLIRDDGTSVAIGNVPAANTMLVVGPTSQSIGFTATTNAASGVGVYGFGLGSSSIGVYGQGTGAGTVGVGTTAGTGVGVQGSGQYAGVTGASVAAAGYGVQGSAPAVGVRGIATSDYGYGVQGSVSGTSFSYGVSGISSSSSFNSAGVAGVSSGNAMGGYFQTNTPGVYALLAYNGAGSNAFQAQGTSNFTGAVSMNTTLNVGGNATLGDGTTDRTTINGELVLGSQAATPTGVNGMTYYNSLNNKFKCYEAGVWVNCGAEEDTLATVSARGRFTGTYISVNGGTASFDTGVASYGSGIGVSGQAGAGGTGLSGWGGSIGVQGTGTSYGVYGSTGGTYGGYFSGGSYGSYNYGTSYGVRAAGGSYGIYASGSSYAFYGSGNAYISGDLGVGAGPTRKLDVRGDARIDGPIYIYSAAGPQISIEADNVDNWIRFWDYGASWFSMGFDQSLNGFAINGGSGLNSGGFFMRYDYGWTGIGRYPTANRLEVNGAASKTTSGSWLANSDRRIKTDIEPVTDALDVLKRLRPVKFRYEDAYAEQNGIEDMEYYNFIAQEYQDVFPTYVKDGGDTFGDIDGILQIDSYPAQVYAIAAVKELDLKIDENGAAVLERLDDHEKRIQELEERIEELERGLERS